MGNIEATAEGTSKVLFEDGFISLDPTSYKYVGNRAIVVHAGEDDLGVGGNHGSQIYGNAGSRVACGIIKIVNQQ